MPTGWTRILVAAAALSGAARASAQDAPVNYQDQLLPLFQTHCLGCHNSEKKKGDLDLSTYTAALAGGGSGELARAGDPSNSTLWKVVAHLDEPHMPPKKPKLPEAELSLLRKWIEGGLLEAKGGVAKKPSKPKVDLALGTAPRGKPEGPLPMPRDLLLEPVVRTSRTESITALAANPWGPLVAISGQHQVLLYNSETLDFVGVLPFPERRIHVLRFSRNGRLLLAAGGHGAKSGAVVVWDLKSGDRLFEVGGEFDLVLAADLSPDHSQIALGGPGKLVKIWSTKDGELEHSIKKHTDWVTALEFSPDGTYLASGDRNGGLHIWEARSGNIHHTLAGHKGAITSISWRPDSALLASSSEDGQVTVWEVQGGTKVKGWTAHPAVESVQYAMDGRLVTAGRDQMARLWTADGAKQREFEAFPDVALRAVVTHDGSKVVAGDWTGEVRVFSAADGKRLGSWSINPPGLAERIKADTKALAEARASLGPAQDSEKAAQKKLDELSGQLKAAEASQAEADRAIGAAREAVAAAQADVAARQAEATQKAEIAKGSALSLQKATQELQKLQESNQALLKEVESDPSKAKLLADSQKAASEKAAEVAQLSESAEKARAAAESAQGAMGPAQKSLADRQAAAKSLSEKKSAAAGALPDRQKRSTDLAAQAARAHEAAQAISSQVASLEARLALWQAGQANQKVHAQKTEVARLQAEHDSLLAQVDGTRKSADQARLRATEAARAAAGMKDRVAQLEAALKEAGWEPSRASDAREKARKLLVATDAKVSAGRLLVQQLGDQAKADPGNPSLAQSLEKAKEALATQEKEASEVKAAFAAREADVEKARSAVPVALKALDEGRHAEAQARAKAADLDRAAQAAAAEIPQAQAKAEASKPRVEAARAEAARLQAEYARLLPPR
jgi:WD40 repeat protein